MSRRRQSEPKEQLPARIQEAQKLFDDIQVLERNLAKKETFSLPADIKELFKQVDRNEGTVDDAEAIRKFEEWKKNALDAHQKLKKEYETQEFKLHEEDNYYWILKSALDNQDVAYIESILAEKEVVKKPEQTTQKSISLTPKKVENKWYEYFQIRKLAQCVLIDVLRLRRILMILSVLVAFLALFIAFTLHTDNEVSLAAISTILLISLVLNIMFVTLIVVGGHKSGRGKKTFISMILGLGLLLLQLITLSTHLGSSDSNISMIKTAAGAGIGVSVTFAMLHYASRLRVVKYDGVLAAAEDLVGTHDSRSSGETVGIGYDDGRGKEHL